MLKKPSQKPDVLESDGLGRDLIELADKFDELRAKIDAPEIQASIKRVDDAVQELIYSHSGSWLGTQSLVYYDGLNPIPAGAHFNVEWGLQRSTGTWICCSFDDIQKLLKKVAGKPTFDQIKAVGRSVKPLLENEKEELISVLTTCVEDPYISRLLTKVNECVLRSPRDFIAALRPTGTLFSRDRAATGGIFTPPHIAVGAEMMELHVMSSVAEELAGIAKQGASHLSRQRKNKLPNKTGSKIFIGHGRSNAWRDLKDFLRERLNLEFDEFNRVSTAGYATVMRLSQMLDDAAMAFIIMTAEDEHGDGAKHARMNVVHEAGLFQGRLGFNRAIILLEDGCEEFSNIEGLSQIRFPPGKIDSVMDKIRAVLEREGIVSAP